jgi:hypothetical protein
MSGDSSERAHAEPIDVDFEPAERPRPRPQGGGGVGMGALIACSTAAALAGGALGALAPRTPAVQTALDAVAPDALTQVRTAQAAADREMTELRAKFDNIQVATASKQDLAQLRQSLEIADKRLMGAQGLMTVETAAGVDVVTIASRIAGLQSSVSGIETKLSTAATQSEVAALSEELKKLQAGFGDVAKQVELASKAATAAYAVSAATDAARASGSFEQAYVQLARILPEDPNVQALAALAKQGAPSVGELKEEWRKIETTIVRASRTSSAGEDFFSQVNAWLAQFIVVRRVGDGDTASNAVQRASSRVAADDLAGALKELATLQGAAAQAAAPWVSQARTRVEIDQRLLAIRAELAKQS